MDTVPYNGQYSQPARPSKHLTGDDPDYMGKYPGARVQTTKPSSPVRVRSPSFPIQEPFSALIENEPLPQARENRPVQKRPVHSMQFPNEARMQSRDDGGVRRKPLATRPKLGDRHSSIRTVSQGTDSDDGVSLPFRQGHARMESEPSPAPPKVFATDHDDPLHPTTLQAESSEDFEEETQEYEQLHYHHDWDEPEKKQKIPKAAHERLVSSVSDSHTASTGDGHSSTSSGYREAWGNQGKPQRPYSTALTSSSHNRGRSLTPQDMRSESSLSPYGRNKSAGRSPDSRPLSTMDLLNVSYSQQMAQQNVSLDNAKLRGSVGANASLLDTRKTLDMYRANVKKTNDPSVSYEFALFMIQAAQTAAAMGDAYDSISPAPESDGLSTAKDQAKLLQEARQILQRLADRTYVFAQYYLADGYASGLFNKGKPDHERAFNLFVSAGKHGHAESSFRAALCYEFGWGCRRDYAKAVQFYRQAASKGHPGAAGRLGNACLAGDMGLAGRYREGINWLKRATEAADHQHNAAPYELGLLHLTGYGDDIFKDEGYAAQLFTKAAELGHAEASLRMGEAYEHGLLTCPKDPALSIHFFTGAAQAGLPRAMMALCAWYMVGAEPVLDKDEAEAYEWAKQAAASGYAKAEYAVGYFTEMGIGCRRDPLEANVWYVRAADQGDERARQRLQIIRTAETGDPLLSPSSSSSLAVAQPKSSKGILKKKKSVAVGGDEAGAAGVEKDLKDDKDCVVM